MADCGILDLRSFGGATLPWGHPGERGARDGTRDAFEIPGMAKRQTRERKPRARPRNTLRRYTGKRDFALTKEPPGRISSAAGRIFVVQKHAARRLHYDFRLELDGVLKSWAVPKGPSLRPSEKRLAVQVEDHPVEYANFEGSIPRGQYGGGDVIVWDKGTWSPLGDPREGLAEGRLRFTLDGKRLRGQWVLVRMKSGRRQADTKQPPWLLMKSADEFADEAGDEITSRETEGAPARASVEQAAVVHGRRARMPASVEPELATLVDEAPRDPGWWFELKVDGYRAIAYVDRGKARIVSRGGLDWTARYPSIAEALGRLAVESAVLDGEICALAEDGTTSFGALQTAAKTGRSSTLAYVIFDLLYRDGEDLRLLPLSKRKAALAQILAGTRLPLHPIEHVAGNGDRLFREACRRGHEGIVGKRSDAPYTSGRSRTWVKVKCEKRDEFVIVGFTPPKGKRTGLGALVVATRETPKRGAPLTFAGKVGTGFDEATLSALESRLRPLAQSAPPVSVPRGVAGIRDTTWVEPALVCEIQFSEWTADGRLRHPVFVGLREDKPATAVARERAARPEDVERRSPPAPEPKPKRANRPKSKREASAASTAKASASSAHGVPITHADRVIDLESGTTKGELAAYYGLVADRILAYAHRRPLALVRCPEGIGGTCFFQQHGPEGLTDHVHRDRIGKHRVLDVDSPAGIISLVQFGAVELHGWGSRLPTWQKPDWIVFDLDPDERVPFSKVAEGARKVRELLDEFDLRSFVKTTGGKGLHVVVPVAPEATFESARGFARRLAETLAGRAPASYVASASKEQRKGKTFVDYLRNGEGTTAVLPWSARARPSLPVAMPVDWKELDRLDPAAFTVSTVPKLLERGWEDPWRDLLATRQRLPEGVS